MKNTMAAEGLSGRWWRWGHAARACAWILAGVLCGWTQAPLSAALIAGQDFNGLTLVTDGPQHTDNGDKLSLPGTFYVGGEFGLGFETFWFETPLAITNGDRGPSATPGQWDHNGVTAANYDRLPEISPSGTAVQAGQEQNFSFDDADGRLELQFDPVDISGYKEVTVSFQFWVNNEFTPQIFQTWEANRFGLVITDGITTETAYLLEGDAIGNLGSAGASPIWHEVNYSLEDSSLTGSNLQVIIFAETDGFENTIVIDDVVIEGTHVPEPSPVLLLMLALAARFFLRRPPR